MRSPVLLLIFNRPEAVRASFACIRAARPARLYVAADGPRPHKAGEDVLCSQARAAATAVDWPCEVKTLFRKRNLGCAQAVSSALTWFFQQEPEGVVLEDDLSAHPDFFPFCDDMLAHYRETDKVMHISGNNFQFGLRRGTASYYFSCFPHCWGWASWARAWQRFDSAMPGLSSFLQNELPGMFTSPDTLEYFRHELTSTNAGKTDSWAFRWTYSIWRDRGLCVLPNVNLAGNFGFNAQGTHTLQRSIFEMVPVQPLGTLVHADVLERDYVADDCSGRLVFSWRGSSLESLLEEIAGRMENSRLEGARGLLNRAREFYGELPQVLHMDALLALKEGDAEAVLRHVETLCGHFPEYAAQNKVTGLIRAMRT